jgi:uncharacterized membrane protein
MSPTAWILWLWLAFTATHLGLASVRVEPGLRSRLGDAGFLGLYSVVALAFFVPLAWIYFAHRHAGSWLWAVSVGPALRAALYLGITFGLVLVVGALVKPSPAAVVPGEPQVAGVYRITRHPLVLGLAVVWALHLIPNGSSADVAFFGGFLIFSLLGAWHQDRRKLASGSPAFRRFYDETGFLPFSRKGSLLGIREIPPWVMVGGFVLALGIRWLHGSLWPH